jgi:2-iminobutanoate/2-iminopropanoate deaminase
MLSHRNIAVLYLTLWSAALCTAFNPASARGQLYSNSKFARHISRVPFPFSLPTGIVTVRTRHQLRSPIEGALSPRVSLSASAGDAAPALREIISLRDKGLITDEDFTRVKAEILARVIERAGDMPAGGIKRTDVVSDKLFRAKGPFSHVVKVSGVREMVFTGTITALDRDWNVVGDTIEDQTRHTIEQLKIALAEVGASIQDVVSVTWYLVDIDHMPRVAKVREEMFEGCRPASGTIPINNLLLPELMLEVSAIAVLP